MPNKITNNIVSIDNEIYNYLNNVNYRNRINYLKLHFSKLIKPKSVWFLVIDDTVNPKIQAKKMQGLIYNHSHTKSKNLWSHCIVISNFV